MGSLKMNKKADGQAATDDEVVTLEDETTVVDGEGEDGNTDETQSDDNEGEGAQETATESDDVVVTIGEETPPTEVSILARPEGRALQPACRTPCLPCLRFNPRPPRRAGATVRL